MKKTKRYIGFDLGAESGRCVVGTLKDEELLLREIYRFATPSLLYNGHLYWDILAVVQEMEKGLKAARENFGDRFDGISVDTWGVDYVLMDAEERLLGYPYHYRDDRTDGMIEAAFKIVPQPELYEKTGIQFNRINTLYQLLAEKGQKLNLLETAAHLLLIPDFLLFVLSGVKKAEYTIVSTTNLADPYTRDWHWVLMKKFGLPRRLFPEVIEPGTLLGSLQEDLAKRTGLHSDTPVIAGAGHDTAAAVASIPFESDHCGFLSSGTWSLMGVERPEPLLTPKSLAYNFTNEGGVAGTIRFLKNIMGLWPVQECRRAWELDGKKIGYPDLEKMASENGSAKSWIDVDDGRFLKAGHMPEKIVAFLKETGQPYKKEAGWLTRCVLESLAFKYRTTLRELEEVTGQSLERLHAVGGGIQNGLLNQLTADAIGREVVAGPVEGAAAGNIGMQAIAKGDIRSLPELRKIVRRSFELKTYTPRNSGYFQENEQNFLKILAGRK